MAGNLTGMTRQMLVHTQIRDMLLRIGTVYIVIQSCGQYEAVLVQPGLMALMTVTVESVMVRTHERIAAKMKLLRAFEEHGTGDISADG